MSQQVNLLNLDVLGPKRPALSAMVMVQVLLAIAVGGLAFYGYLVYDTMQLKAAAVDGERRLAAQRQQLQTLSAQLGVERRSQLLEAEIKTTEARLRQYREAVEALKSGNFGNTRGYSEHLRALARQSVSGLWLTGFSIEGAGSGIALDGRALRAELVPAYLQKLNAEPVMQGLSFSGLEIFVPKGTDVQRGATSPFLEFSLRSEGAGGRP